MRTRLIFIGDYPTESSLPQDTDVLYLKLFTTQFVILNSSEAIVDLTEKRSNIYSDRVSGSPSGAHAKALADAYHGDDQPDMPMLEL